MTVVGNLHRAALAAQLGRPPGHYDLTIAVLADLTDEQRAWTRRRIHTARHRDLLAWAATTAVFLVCAAVVVYTYTVGGWRAAAVATLFVAVAAGSGVWAAQR